MAQLTKDEIKKIDAQLLGESLSQDTCYRILREAILGVPAPNDESDAEREFRKGCEQRVKDAKAAGITLEIPFDP